MIFTTYCESRYISNNTKNIKSTKLKINEFKSKSGRHWLCKIIKNIGFKVYKIFFLHFYKLDGYYPICYSD